MSSGHKKEVIIDPDATYEENTIGLRGIVMFTLGLIILIGVTFGLMKVLQDVMEDQAAQGDKKMPMAMTQEERLPPEPRLQAAPGSQVRLESGETVSLELKQPQAEYWALRKEWEDIWANGRKSKDGTMISMPIEEAKKKMLEQGLPTRQMDDGQKVFEQARQMPSFSSAGRNTEIRRQ